MRSLRELQLEFSGAILRGRAADFATGRLQIYRNNVFLSLEDALADVYLAVKRLVGDTWFRQAARRFIREHPSRSGNLHDFGRELPAFLRALPDTGHLPYLGDVAFLEWSWHEAFHAGDAAPLAVERLAALDDEAQVRVRFSLHPAVRLIASRYPILAIWEANRDKTPDPPEIDLAAGPDWLLVHRRGLERVIERLGPGEFALVAALASGLPLAEGCEAAAAAEPGIDLGAAMGRLIVRGLPTDCHV